MTALDALTLLACFLLSGIPLPLAYLVASFRGTSGDPRR